MIVLAITRILTKNSNIPVTTATGVMEEMGREKTLMAGANVLVLSMTPATYRKYYEIYPGKDLSSWDRKDLTDFLSSTGREIGRGGQEN